MLLLAGWVVEAASCFSLCDVHSFAWGSVAPQQYVCHLSIRDLVERERISTLHTPRQLIGLDKSQWMHQLICTVITPKKLHFLVELSIKQRLKEESSSSHTSNVVVSHPCVFFLKPINPPVLVLDPIHVYPSMY